MKNISYFVGIDQHKETSRVAVLDGRGERVDEFQVHHDAVHVLDEHLKRLSGGVAVALEATGFYDWMVDRLVGLGVEVHLAHPSGLRLISEAKNKTDRNDARRLARLLWLGSLPEAYIPTAAEREVRWLLGTRRMLTTTRSRLTNRVRSLLMRRRLPMPTGRVYGKKGFAECETVDVPAGYGVAYHQLLEQVREMTKSIRELDKQVVSRCQQDPRASELNEILGFGPLSALAVVAYLGDPKRFPARKQVASFAGLTPRVYSSGPKQRHGGIDRKGNPELRRILVEVIQIMVARNAIAQEYYGYLGPRRGGKRAIVAMARKILVGIHAAWKRGEKFQLDKCLRVPTTREYALTKQDEAIEAPKTRPPARQIPGRPPGQAVNRSGGGPPSPTALATEPNDGESVDG